MFSFVCRIVFWFKKLRLGRELSENEKLHIRSSFQISTGFALLALLVVALVGIPALLMWAKVRYEFTHFSELVPLLLAKLGWELPSLSWDGFTVPTWAIILILVAMALWVVWTLFKVRR